MSMQSKQCKKMAKMSIYFILAWKVLAWVRHFRNFLFYLKANSIWRLNKMSLKKKRTSALTILNLFNLQLIWFLLYVLGLFLLGSFLFTLMIYYSEGAYSIKFIQYFMDWSQYVLHVQILSSVSDIFLCIFFKEKLQINQSHLVWLIDTVMLWFILNKALKANGKKKKNNPNP